MSEPFAFYHLPDGVSVGADSQFEIAPWLTPYAERIVVTAPEELSPSQSFCLVDLTAVDLTDSDIERLHTDYLEATDAIIRRCRERDGKTVFSRIIRGRNPHLSPILAAQNLFAAFPDAFGFLFNAPETGCWLGATPETLLNFDYRTRRVETMAYAGTRPFAGEEPWDEKNLRENQFVADHIVGKFRELGIEPSVTAPYSSAYGMLQHLRRDISATLPADIDFSRLLDLINPTPALCGTPTDAAIADINRYESAPRGCYGGFVAIHQPDEFFRAYVCLRCARIYPDGSFEIHAGGGLTPDSSPMLEFRESAAKAAPLLSILLSKNN